MEARTLYPLNGRQVEALIEYHRGRIHEISHPNSPVGASFQADVNFHSGEIAALQDVQKEDASGTTP